MYDEKRSYMPQWVAAPAVDLFDAVWKEIQEPVGEYLEEEFDRAIGVLHEEPYDAEAAAAAANRAHKQEAESRGVCTMIADGLVAFRGGWLHAMYPFDRSFWKMIKNPTFAPLMLASMFPFYGVSPIYWVTTFLLLDKRDEYQLCQFICGFKGLMAFTTGIIGIMTGGARSAICADRLLGCVAAGAPNGLASCPLDQVYGVSCWTGAYATFWWDMSCWLVEVFTVWAAFALLPFSTDKAAMLRKRNPHLHHGRLRRDSDSESEDEYDCAEEADHPALRHRHTTVQRAHWQARAAREEDGYGRAFSSDDDDDDDDDDDSQADESGRKGPPSLARLRRSMKRSIHSLYDAVHTRMPSICPGVRLQAILGFVVRRAAFIGAVSTLVACTAWFTLLELNALGFPTYLVLALLLLIVFKDFLNPFVKTLTYLGAVSTLAVGVFVSAAYGSLPPSTPLLLTLAFALGWYLPPMLGVQPDETVRRIAVCGRGGQCKTWGLPTCPFWLPCCALWCCSRWPQSPFTQNALRRGGLLRRMFNYELGISTVCAAIVAFEGVRMLLRVLPPEEERAALMGDGAAAAAAAGVAATASANFTASDGGHVGNVSAATAFAASAGLDASAPTERLLLGTTFALAYSRLGQLEDLQYRAVLFWTRVIYGLLSLPFAVFTLPFAFQALTHSRPTGYDKRGRCVRQLSAHERSLYSEPLAYTWGDVFNVLTCKACRQTVQEELSEVPVVRWVDLPRTGQPKPVGRSSAALWAILRKNWRLAAAVKGAPRGFWVNDDGERVALTDLRDQFGQVRWKQVYRAVQEECPPGHH